MSKVARKIVGKRQVQPASEPRVSRTRQPKVFSYYTGTQKKVAERSRHTPEDAAPLQEKMRRVLSIVIVIVSLLAVFQIVRLDGSVVVAVQASTSTVADEQSTLFLLRDKEEYKDFSEAVLAMSWQNATKLGLRSTELARELTEKYPEIQRASVSTDTLGRRVRVRLMVRQPALVLETLERRYVVANDGMVVSDDVAHIAALSFTVPTVIDEANVSVRVGEFAMSSGDVASVRFAADQFSAANRKIIRYALSEQGRDLLLRTEDNPFYIRMLLEEDVKTQVGAALAFLDKQSANPSEYIDVRIPGRIYYR